MTDREVHTARCVELSGRIERIEEDVADLSADDRPDLPEVGEEIDVLDMTRDELVDEQNHLHTSGQCFGAELELLRAAVELHRPVRYDRHSYKIDAGDNTTEVKQRRCGECARSVPAGGCKTWDIAHGGRG